MKDQVKTPVIVVAVVAVIAIMVYFGMKTVGEAGSLDHGQIKYTPGKPPWMETDPNKKGPGGAPNGGNVPGRPPAPVNAGN
jgi:hypothetical protein